MRYVVCMTVVVVGCVATLPPDDPTITADIAAETAREILRLRQEVAPAPGPKPGDKCANCDGRGYVGDGTVRVKCQPCDGTGKVR
jgi:hypothetical protein